MSRLVRLLLWRSGEDDSVQYEIHRMTHRGGWENAFKEVHIPAGEPRPADDDNFWILGPGRYRYIRRVDGRIDEMVWAYETKEAKEHYEQQCKEEELKQERGRQRTQLQEMSLEEVKAEYLGETNRLDKLSLQEIADPYETLRE